MFNSKVESDKGQLEIVYDVQWKTPGNDDDKAKIIGIVDTPDIYLDWNTFKSYLIQNSGNMSFTTDDIRISYLDSDDDLIPIDSASEFRECLKFSRTRARRGRKIMMKVSLVSNGGAKPKIYGSKYSGESSSKYSGEPSKYSNLFCLKKKDITPNIKKPEIPPPKVEVDANAVVPQWFEAYMTKFKADLIEEITSVVNNAGTTTTTINNPPRSTETPPQKEPHQYYPLQHMIEKRKKKKKMPEEDSSDCTDGLQLQWEERLELLRHMQKINKREKKFEKKLDAKLEKLESKTKKIMEKKHNLWGSKKSTGIPLPSHEVYSSSSQITTAPTAPAAANCDNFVANQCMDAVPADEHYFVPHVLGGELVHQVWKVVNSGQKHWTDETELRFAWGSKSLVPVTTAVKCPLLKPGETGKVNVTLQAPLFAGHFESYWHFHHQGRRFGHWLGCEVIVDPEPRPLTPEQYRIQKPTILTTTTITATKLVEAKAPPPNIYETDGVPSSSLPVDLTMKSYSDDMKIYNNIEIKPDVIEVKPIEQQCIQKEAEPQLNKLETAGFHLSAFLAQQQQQQQQQQNNLTTIEDIFGANINFPMPSLVPTAAAITTTEEQKQENRDVYEEIYGEVLTGVENISIKEDNIENEKKLNEDLERQSVAAEYNSGSDSDNISILSDTISVDTDSEPSEEFVVVPMPTCLDCEQEQELELDQEEPLTSLASTSTPTPEDIQPASSSSSDNNNNMEDLKPFPEMPELFLPPMPESCAEPSQTQSQSQLPNELESDPNTVFIRDETGMAIPVAKVVQQPCALAAPTTMKHSTFGDPNFGHGPNGPRFPLMNAEPHSPPPLSHNPVGPCNFRPQHGSPSQHHPVPIYSTTTGTHQGGYPFDEMYQAQEMANTTSGIRPATWTNTYQNIYTEQPRACKFTYAYTNSSKENLSNSSSSGSRRTSSDTREASPVAAAVQILPETLVTGAVNVASSAINTARSVIDMLRPRHDEPLVAQWDPITPAMDAALRQLSEMGFNNRELNIMLLKQHKNDVARVISELVQ